MLFRSLREAICESKAVELNIIQAFDYLADKLKLSEKTSDYRREALRNRGPLIINGPADDLERISYIKEELEELGYATMMVFVDTTNEASQERNTKLSRMMVESVRQDKWNQAQKNRDTFLEGFENFIHFDNNSTLESIEEDITLSYRVINAFLDDRTHSEAATTWLENHNKLNINEKFNRLFKEDTNVKKNSKFIQSLKANGNSAAGPSDIPADNRASEPANGDIKWDRNIKRGSYTFRTYTEAKAPTLKVSAPPKEPNFQKDNDKNKRLKRGDTSQSASRVSKPSGLGPEWSTRTNGSGLTGGAGLGNSTYSESQEYSNANPASTAMPSGGSPNPLSSDYNVKKPFDKFRNRVKKESIDSPSVDMGVGGVLGGASNKEPLQTPMDKFGLSGITIKKKKKQEK